MTKNKAEIFLHTLRFGDEHYLRFEGSDYCMQGYFISGHALLEISRLKDGKRECLWRQVAGDERFPVDEFAQQPLFSGKCFMDAAADIEWLEKR